MPERIINMGDGVPSHQVKKDFVRRAWHVFYLRPRNERIASRLISNHGYEVFCPEVQKIKRWKNRQKKKVSLPLFPNYLFVYTYPHELFAIRSFSQVVNFVSFAGKPSIISEKEIHGIRIMLKVGVAITVETQFSSGEHVRIVSGPLKGHEGILIRRRNKSRFGIRLKAINHAVFIDIGQSDLEKL